MPASVNAAFEPCSRTPGPLSLVNGWRMSGGSSQTRSPRVADALFESSDMQPQSEVRQNCRKTLFSFPKQHRSGYRLVRAQHFHGDAVAGFLAPERIRKIVQIGNCLAIKLNQDVAGL